MRKHNNADNIFTNTHTLTHIPIHKNITTSFNKTSTHAISKVLTSIGQITYYAITKINPDDHPNDHPNNHLNTPKIIKHKFMYSVLPKAHKSFITKDITHKSYNINNYVKWLNNSYFIIASSRKHKKYNTHQYQLFYIDIAHPNPVFIMYISPTIKPTQNPSLYSSIFIMQLNYDAIYISQSITYGKFENGLIDFKNNTQLILSYVSSSNSKYIRNWAMSEIYDLPFQT